MHIKLNYHEIPNYNQHIVEERIENEHLNGIINVDALEK
jgi:hypothetical protein